MPFQDYHRLNGVVKQLDEPMGAPRVYTDAHRAAIHELVNNEGQAFAQAARTLANGYQDLEPVDISRDTVARIAREARAFGAGDVGTLELADALDHLGRKSLAIIGYRLAQVQADPTRFESAEILTIMRSLTEAKGLVKAKRANNQGTEPTFLELVDTPHDTNASANQTPQTKGPVSVRVARGSS